MAVQTQNQNQLLEVAQALKRRAGQVLLPAAVIVSLGVALSGLMPQKYTARTGLEVRESPLPISGQGMDASTIQRDVTATPWQITQFERVRRVIEKLEWPEYTALSPLEQYEFVRDQIKNVKPNVLAAKNNQGSSLITIEYTSDDPQRAEQFLNRLREAYTQEVLERYRLDARRNLDLLRNTMTAAAETLKKRNEESAKFQKDYGISATQQAPGGGRQRDEDPVYTRQKQAEDKLFDLEGQIAGETAGLEVLRKQFREEPLEVSEALLAGGGISFDDELAKIETSIADLRESQRGYKEPHSLYQDAERKIRFLQEKEKALRERATSPELKTAQRPNPRRDQLLADIQAKELTLKQFEAARAQLEADVKTLREQNAQRAEIFRELRDLDARATIANDNYQRASLAYEAQKRFVDQITEGTSNPFEVTELARAPTQPSSPSGALVIGAAAVLGLGAGLLWALASEFGRNGFRGVADAGRALAVPVLGVVNRIRTQRERRDESLRRALAGVATLALVASILWISWAFEHRPQLLGHGIVQAMSDLRDALK